MRRRSLLAALAAGTAATAGCSGVLDSEDPPTPEDPSSGTPPSTPTETGPTTPASQVDLSLPFEAVSPEAAADGPAVPDDWVAYGRSASALQVVPEAVSFGHEEPVRFALANGTDSTVQFNPYNWRLHKHAAGEWVRIEPTVIPEPVTDLPSGESHVWELATIAESRPDSWRRTDRSTLRLDRLGGGTYAFSTAGVVDSPPLATTVTLDAPELSLSVREGTTVTDDGSPLRAERPHDDRIERITVSAADDAADPTVHCAESLRRRPLLGDALALLRDRDAESVVVVGPSNVQATADPVRESTITFDGAAYAVRREFASAE